MGHDDKKSRLSLRASAKQSAEHSRIKQIASGFAGLSLRNDTSLLLGRRSTTDI
jgi:hypothetical protein